MAVREVLLILLLRIYRPKEKRVVKILESAREFLINQNEKLIMLYLNLVMKDELEDKGQILYERL